MALRLVRDLSPTPDIDRPDFATWLADQGTAVSTATAYSQDVSRLGLTATTTRAVHESTAQEILASPFAASTRTRRLAACARFYDFTHALADGSNPYRLVRRPKQGVVLPSVVTTPEQARQAIEWFATRGLDGLMYAAAIALCAGAGLRVGEVVTVTWAALDLDRGNVRAVGKGDKTRDVPLGEFATTVLRLYYDAVAERAAPRPGDRVVPVTERTVQRAVARVGRVLGLGRMHPHAFRHGFATAVYGSTTDLQVTGDLLGHASLATTRVYVHLSDDRRRSAVAAAL